jgi:cytochrome c556
MMTKTAAGLSLAVLIATGACRASQPPADTTYRPTATIKDIMDSMLDQNADVVWDAVATEISATGTEQKAPKTPEEWIAVRRHAIPIMEATNLLLIPGRKVAHPGEKSDNPKVELAPEQIQALIDQDRAAFVTLAHGLHDAMTVAIKAIDDKNPDALFDAGDGIDKACENCHLKYWYPGKQAPGQ